jgi:hypothetical protein
MDIEHLKNFFKWCTIINGILLGFSIILCILIPDLIYSVQGKLFHISHGNFNMVFYSFLGLFKIFWLVFNVTPYIALIIIGKK